MCKAFSALITKRNKVYWKAGVDGHEDLRELFKKDKDLEDKTNPPHNTFARIEIHPKNGNYLQPDTWVYTIDERVKPDWITESHKKLVYTALEKWKKEVYSFNIKEAIHPIHPFLLPSPKKITRKHILALKTWGSVRGSVRGSVWDSVRDSVWGSVWGSVWDSVWGSVWGSVWDSVRDSVWDSVWDSVRDSVWGSVWAYIGSLFPNIKKWKYVNNRKSPFQKIKGYPFQSAVTLWKQGLVPSFDGMTWRLHTGKNATVVFEITKEKLMKYK